MARCGTLYFLALTLVLAPSAQAGLIRVRLLGDAELRLSDAASLKQAKKVRDEILKARADSLVDTGSEQYLIGEPIEGVRFESGRVMTGGTELKLLVGDSKNPASVPYALDQKTGAMKDLKKSALVTLPMAVVHWTVLDASATLWSQAREFTERTQEVSQAETALKAATKDTKYAATQKLIARQFQLVQWLKGGGYALAAASAQKKAEATQKGLDQAPAEITITEVDASVVAEFNQKLQKLLPGAVGRALESQHVRLFFAEAESEGRLPGISISQAQARELLRVAELTIAGFEANWVSPFPAIPNWSGRLPARVIHEAVFIPVDSDDASQVNEAYQQLYTDFFGKQWSGEQDLKFAGQRNLVRRGSNTAFLAYQKQVRGTDLLANLIHPLMHSLVDFQFNDGKLDFPEPQPWVSEGLAIDYSIRYAGNNRITCVDFLKKTGTVSDRADSYKEKELYAGTRDQLMHLAEHAIKERGETLLSMAQSNIRDLDRYRAALGWSMVNYLLEAQGQLGVEWILSAYENPRREKRAGESIEAYLQKSPINPLLWQESAARIFAPVSGGAGPGQILQFLTKDWQKKSGRAS